MSKVNLTTNFSILVQIIIGLITFNSINDKSYPILSNLNPVILSSLIIKINSRTFKSLANLNHDLVNGK